MASGRQKTTMNKINRERKLREKRIEKQERKLARANGLLSTDTDPQIDSYTQFDLETQVEGETQRNGETELATDIEIDVEAHSGG